MIVDTNAILALPTAEKLELLELLWDNLGQTDATIPKDIDREAARRRDELLADPNFGQSHDATWANIAKRND